MTAQETRQKFTALERAIFNLQADKRELENRVRLLEARLGALEAPHPVRKVA